MPYEKLPEALRDPMSTALTSAADQKPGEFKGAFEDIMRIKALDAIGNYRQSMFGGHGYTNQED